MYAVGATNPAIVAALQKNGAKFVTAKDVGFPSRLVNNNWRDIGPHVGFAYRAGEGKKSFVVRGGFSTSYFPVPIYGWNNRMRLNSPFTGFYQNMQLTNGGESPDRHSELRSGLRSDDHCRQEQRQRDQPEQPDQSYDRRPGVFGSLVQPEPAQLARP
jgi:hypothetical protein